MDQEKIIIIGGGLNGLFSGAILAREGFDVSVFEKDNVPGGSLREFQREGVSFETGIHAVGAFRPGEAMYRLFNYLKIWNKLDLLPVDPRYTEIYRVGKEEYCFPRGKEQLVSMLMEEFPAQGEDIRRYFDALYKLSEESQLHDLRMPSPRARSYGLTWSAGKLIDAFLRDDDTRNMLALRSALYAGEQYKTPAYLHALANKMYTDGTARFIGGSQQLATALVGAITSNGGKVYTGRGIKRVEISGNQVDHVVSTDGRQHRAARYIMAIDPLSMLDIVDRGKLQPACLQQIEALMPNYSTFTLFIILQPGAFSFFNHARGYVESLDDAWGQVKCKRRDWPRGLTCSTPPETIRDRYARKMVVDCVMSFKQVKRWEHTVTGSRPKSYQTFKHLQEEAVIKMLERVFPDIRPCIQSVYSATPLTFRDYCNRKGGSVYGFKQQAGQPEFARLSAGAGLDNLLLVGQNDHLHGTLVTPVSVIEACAELVGLDYLLKRINE